MPDVASQAPIAVAAAAVIDDEARLDDDIEVRWRTAVEAINAQKRMLGAFLQESRLVGVTSRALVLAMDHLHRSVVDERDNRALVERHVADAFGAALFLQCVVEVGGAARPSREDVKPLVDRAIAWFEGDVIQRPAGDGGRSEG